jgi:endonuclease/exonuclease/phosphatase family metal-dependent hydrolase
MRKTISALAFAIATLAAFSCAHFQRSSSLPTIRVMTYNIRSGNGDLAKTADAIRSEAPDIVGLQEVDVHWAERSGFADQATQLGAMLGMNVRFARIYDLDPIRSGEPRRQFGVALLTRFPVVEWANHEIARLSTQDPNPVPQPMPGFLEARIEVRGTIICVFNTHLDYRADPKVREMQVRDILRYMADSTLPTVFVGDLNAGPDAAELQPLRAKLRDVWSDAAGPGLTYPADKPEKRIDMILVSSHFRPLGAHVPATQASDHRPVVADLQLK